MHGAVAARLAGQDQDQEVKDAAIAATAALVATLGDELRAQVPALLQARTQAEPQLISVRGPAVQPALHQSRTTRSFCSLYATNHVLWPSAVN